MPTVSSNAANSAHAKENVLAWERWNPGALRAETPGPERRKPVSDETLARNAYAAGFEAGRRAGREAGYAEGRRRAADEVARIALVAQSAHDALQALGDTLSHKTVALAIAIAQKIVQHDIATRPERIIETVRSALKLLPDGEARVRIHANSADAPLLRTYLTENPALAHCVVVESDTVQRGGCHFASPDGDIDATLETRANRVLEALGQQFEPTNES